ALARAARGADGALSDRPRPLPAARADGLVHLRGGVAPPARAAGGERLPRRLPRGGARPRLRLARGRIRGDQGSARGGEPRAGAEAGGEGDRQGHRGRGDPPGPARTGAGSRGALRRAVGRSFPRRERYAAAGRRGGGGGAQEPAPVVRAVLAGAAGREGRALRQVSSRGEGVLSVSKWKVLAVI